MAKYVIQGETLTNIADAIREKTGTTASLFPGNMPSYIRSIQTGSAGSGEAGVPADILEEADRVASGMIAKMGGNSLTFIAMSDMHEMGDGDWPSDPTIISKYRRANLNAGQGAKRIAEQISLDFFANLGDIAWGSRDTTLHDWAQSIVNARGYTAGMEPLTECFFTPGNHDAGYPNGDYDENLVTGMIGSYRYVDFDAKKVRVICLNTADNTDGTDSCERVSGEQLQWFANALDLSGKSNAAEWGLVVLSHHPMDWTGVKQLADCLSAYLNGTAYSATHDGISVSYDYSGKNAATFIGNFHGHTHCFKVADISGTTAKRIAIPNACFGRNNESYAGTEFGEDQTYNKSDDSTGKNTAFCLVSIDLDKKLIYADCFGAGYDRAISYGAEEIVTYTVTNNLSNATTSNGSASAVEGESYTAAIIPNDGYDLVSVTVTMGGANITSSVYRNGNINIPSVTGNIVITVTTQANAALYTVTNNLTKVTNSNSATTAAEGSSYSAILTAKDGYKLGAVTVTMGGQTVTVTDGNINISNVTGDIVITATATSIYNVTNLVSTSQEMGSTAVYNGVGYKDGYYLSSEGGEGVDSTCVVTGYIPFDWVKDSVIYIRGATVSSASHVRIYGYSGKVNTPSAATFASGPTLETYFTVEQPEGAEVDYYKLTVKNTKASTYLRISVIGKGENLIVTVNEPIE